MNYIGFNGTLLLYGFVGVFIFAFCVMALMSPLGLFAKDGSPPKAVVYPLVGLGAIFQVYFWGFWSVVCVALAIKYTERPDVTWDWLYWVTAFFWSTAFIRWFAQKEMQLSESVEESRSIGKGTLGYSLVAISAFLLFSFMPQYSLAPYGFLLQPLGLDTHLISKSTERVEIDEKTRKTIDGFFEGYNYFISANKLAREMTKSKDPLGDLVKVESLMNEANDRLSEVDIELLDKLYDGWGDIVSSKLIPAIELLLSGMQPKGDVNDIARSDDLAAEFNIWLRNNWDNILLMLNKKYKVEIRN